MMFVSLVIAMVVGPWQLWVLASPSRTIGFRTVWLAILAGLAVGFPVAVAVQWMWIGAAAPLWDGSRFELVRWAGWTIDPFIEEVLRLLPLVLVLVFVARVRRQWSMTDLVVAGAGLGSGFRLAEHIARYGQESREPFVSLSDNGWGLGFSVDGTVLVPYPWAFLTQWMPESVQADTIIRDPTPLLRYNLIAIWGALGGLAVGLWLLSGRHAALHRWAWSGRAAAVGLIGFAGLAHAQTNADLIGEDWVFPALGLPRMLEPFYWAWPVAVLLVALLLDRRMIHSQRTHREVVALRIASGGSDLWNLVRLSAQQPLVSVRSVWSFVTTRRALVFTLATSKQDPVDDSADSSPLFDVLEPVAVRFRHQLDHDDDLWADVAAAEKAARRARWSAWRRSPRVWALGGLSLLLMLAPVAYFVAGTSRGGHRIQEWMSEEGSALTNGVAALGVAVGVVVVIARLRGLRQPADVVAEPKARAVLALAITIAAIGSMLFGLFQTGTGVGLEASVYSVHGLDALGSLVWAAALNLGLLALLVANPATGWPLLVEHHRFKSPQDLAARLPWEWQLLFHVGHTVVMAEGRAVPGEWEEGPKPPPPLEAELDAIVEHAWEKHVLGENGGQGEFPEIETKDELRELLEEVIEDATEWGIRGDGSVYWYDDVTDTVVIKNPPGVGGTTYRPGEGQDG